MEWIFLFFLFLVSAFFSASETAFFALRRVDFLKWKEEGNRTAGIIGTMLETPSRVIATLFIGNEFANVSISSVLAAVLIPLVMYFLPMPDEHQLREEQELLSDAGPAARGAKD